jgi:hypothetical protein
VPAIVPAGRYTKAALEKAGLWPRIEAKMIGAQTVRHVLDYVARAEVDAGFVYSTDAALMPDKVKIAFHRADRATRAVPDRRRRCQQQRRGRALRRLCRFAAGAGSPGAL